MSAILQALDQTPLHLRLQRRETLLVNGCGRLRCDAGEVWLTEAGSCRDSILQPGDQWTLRRGVAVALSTLAGASLTLGGSPELPA